MKWWWAGLLLAAAAASIFNIVGLELSHLMDPRWHGSQASAFLLLIGVLTAAGLWLIYSRRAPKRWTIAFAVAIVALGFVPRTIAAYHESQRQAAQAVADRAYEATFLADLESRKQDIEARIATRRVYTADESEAFIDMVRHANMIPRGLPDHTAAAMAALRRAIDGKVFDPNGPVKNRFDAKAPPPPLFIQFHRNIRQAPERPVEAREWKLLLLMTSGGADLSLPGAEAVVADLRKTATPIYDGLYLELK